MLGAALGGNDLALKTLAPEIAEPAGKFDVVVVSAFVANDAAYYLAKHFGADLVLYFTGQVRSKCKG